MSETDYDSGPYCKHWSSPESCETCAIEKVVETLRDSPSYLSDVDLDAICEAVNKEIAKRKEQNG